MNDIIKSTLFAAGGAAVGVIAGMLIAPKSGKETRNEIKEKVDELQSKVESLSGEARIHVEEQIGKLKNTLREVEAQISN